MLYKFLYICAFLKLDLFRNNLLKSLLHRGFFYLLYLENKINIKFFTILVVYVKKYCIFVPSNNKKNKMNNLKTTNFWNHNYRHYMRGLRTSLQSEIKQSFIDFNLELCGVSDLHEELICEIIGDYVIKGENKNERNKRLEHSYQDECFNCQSTLGIDCGEAESDYNEDFCSHGCYVEYIYKK